MGYWEDAATIVTSIVRALNRFDWDRVSKLSNQLTASLTVTPEPFPLAHAKALLNALRRKRRFGEMTQLAAALIGGGQKDAQVWRLYAQAMIDGDNLDGAKVLLKHILDGEGSSAGERAEANGLFGRIYKQLYVNANDRASSIQQGNLRQAIAYYYDTYKTNPDKFTWQGINTVALLVRAGKDEVLVDGYPESAQIAGRIGESLSSLECLKYWDLATAIENAVALGQFKVAYDHLLYYTLDPEVDAFECFSLYRQLTDVWQLNVNSEPGATILPTLKATLRMKLGGNMLLPTGSLREEVAQAAKAQKTLEGVFGADKFQPLAWMNTVFDRCKAIGRVESITGQPVGTGFLVRRGDFFAGGGDEAVLLTNNHVVAPDGKAGARAIEARAGRVVFEVFHDLPVLLDSVVWNSPVGEFDASFVSLQTPPPPGSKVCPMKPQPRAFVSDGTQRLFVIGHPRGGILSVSLQDSIWLDTDDRLLHYRTPTADGSSGSPVFDQDFWTLVGLHHASSPAMQRLNGESGTYEANEGIAIAAVLRETLK